MGLSNNSITGPVIDKLLSGFVDSKKNKGTPGKDFGPICCNVDMVREVV